MPATPDGRAIHEAVARAAGLRHRAFRRHHAWRAAPFVAGLFLVLAVIGRFVGWPAFLAISAGLTLAVLLAGYALLPRQTSSVSDAEATALDDRAALGGELRSAHWFADHAEDGAWISHHLSRAVNRVRETAWAELYAPQRAPRAYAVTAVLAAAAIVIAVMSPATRAANARGVHDDRAAGGIDPALTVVEIERQLAALLATLEAGQASGPRRAATADDVRKLLERIRESQRQSAGRSAAAIDENLRERLDRAAQMESLDADMRNALEDLKNALQKPREQNARKEDGPREATGKTDTPPGNMAQSSKGDGKGDPSGQMSSDSQPGSGFGIVAMTNDPSGDPGKPGLGMGGGEGGSPNAGVMVDLGAALRRETLETGAGESAGDPATDLRHKTDRGTASVAFSRGAAAAAVRGRANAVPIVPEARRPAARAYFQRKR
jgi:transposase